MGGRVDILSMEQAMEMAFFLRGKGRIRHAALVAICAGFGLRIGDALDLKWQNLFAEKGAVKNAVTITERKTKQPRTIKVLPWVRKILVDYYEVVRPFDLATPMFNLSRQRA